MTIDAASIDTGTAQRDTHLRSADFFDVEKFPELRFRSKRIEKIGDDRLRVIGDLTIRDVTREVVARRRAGGRGKDPWGNERLGFVAKTSIDRKDFGLQWNQVLEAGGVLVGDRVDIELDIQAVNAAAATQRRRPMSRKENRHARNQSADQQFATSSTARAAARAVRSRGS